jgi:hypothetical protein
MNTQQTKPLYLALNEKRTKGSFELTFARWAKDAPIVGYLIKCGEKQIAGLNVTTNSQILESDTLAKMG